MAENRFTEQWLADYMARFKASLVPPEPEICRTVFWKEEIDPGPESDLQEKIEKYCREHQFPFFHDRSRKVNVPGFPDLVIALRAGRTLWLELKGKKGVLSAEQKQWRLQLLALGHEHHVVKSYRGFLRIVGGDCETNSH